MGPPWGEWRTTEKGHYVNYPRPLLLIISGETDNAVPWAIANASFKLEQRNVGVTEVVEMPNRGHALVVDSGCEVADTALAFIKRFI